MNNFLVIALVCIFQSIRLSVACYGYTIDVRRVQSGSHNRIQLDDNYRLELSDDCRMSFSFCVTVGGAYNSALVSMKVKSGSLDFFKITRKDFCTFLSDHNIYDLECPSTKAERVCIKFGERANISQFGPFLGLVAGNFTALVRLDYDHEDVPDVFSVDLNIKLKK